MITGKLLAQTAIVEIPTNIAPTTDFGLVVSTLIQTLFLVAGIVMLIFMVVGGVQFITSGGDKIQAQAARDRITYALIGILVVAASFAIAALLQRVLGITILGNLNVPTINNIPVGGT